MSFLSKLLYSKSSNEHFAQSAIDMNAKEKQLTFIKNSLKPLLKAEGYRTEGNKWWKINEPFFNLFEIQNFSWNSRHSVDFCLNFTTGLTTDIKNPVKPTIHDGIPYIREGYFKITKNEYYNGGNGYHIDDNTDLEKFSEHVVNDFKLLILPKFNLLINEDSIINFYADDFWGPRVKQSLAQGRKNVKIES